MPPVDAVRAAPAPALPPILAAPKSVPRVAPGTVLNQAQQHAASAPFRAQEALHSVQPTQHPSGTVRPVSAPVVVHSAAPVATGLGGHETETNAAQRHQAALALISLRHMIQAKGTAGLDTAHSSPHTSGGGLLGSIEAAISPSTALHAAEGVGSTIAHTGVNLGKDLVGLGPGLLQGGEALGAAALHDIGHPSSWGYNLGGMPHSQSALAHVADQAVKTDPIYIGITKGPGAGLKAAEAHPLQAILDAGGITGIAGRAVGAAGRLGGADFASLARAPRELAPGITEPRVYSRNALTAQIQRGLDARPNLQVKLNRATGQSDARLLQRRAIEHGSVVNAVRQEVGHAAAKAAKEQGMEGAKMTTAVRKAQAAATRMLNDEFIQRNSLGESKTLTGARAMRTRRQLGADTQIVAAVLKRGHAVSPFPARIIKEGARHQAGMAEQFHILPSHMVDTLAKYHFPESIPVGNTELHTTPALQVPRNAITEHLNIADKRIGAPQFTRAFRNTVLPFSSKWVTGNITEAALRSALAHAGLGDYRMADAVLKEMHNQGRFREASYLRAHTLGGAHGAFQERLYNEGIGADKRAGTLGRAGTKYHEGIEKIFAANRKAEQKFSQAVLGQHMHDQLGVIGRTGSRQGDIAALAKHYANPDVAAQAGRYSRKVLGKYDTFSPGTQRFIRKLAPFGPWYANSAKFVYHTMPVEHPALSAGLLAAHNGTFADWEKAHASNNPDTGQKILGIPFGSLEYALKTGKASYQDLARYLPFGAATGGPLGWASSPIAPQYATPLANWFGKDAFMKDLFAPGAPSARTPTGRISHATKHQIQGGTLGAIETAISNTLGQESGPINQLHRVFADQGATPYNTEKLWDWTPTMKPGTQRGPRNPLSGANRVFNPFFPIKTQPTKTRKPITRRTFPSTRGLPSFGGGSAGGGPPSL